MRKYSQCSILYNKEIATNIYDMKVKFGDKIPRTRPGQFAEIYVGKGEHLLPRPISLCQVDEEERELRFVYQVAGKGTESFSKMKAGEELNILAPLGNGFNIGIKPDNIGIVGGGVGVPPMLELAKRILRKNPDAKINVFLGFRSEPILAEEFEELGIPTWVSTDDGSHGHKGNVISLMESKDFSCDVVYGCGPKIMLKFLNQWAVRNDTKIFVSMEERMGCGVGVCNGCAIPVKKRNSDDFFYKRVCKEGPVFKGGEVIWDEL